MGQIIHMEDYRLVHNYLSGDKDAGRALYENAYVPLIAYVRKRCKGSGFSETDFEDIASETMCRSVEKLDSFNGTSSFLSFLCGFANYVIKEALRKKGKDIPTDPDDTMLDIENFLFADLSKYGITPEEYVIRKEERERVSRALEQLMTKNQDYYDIVKLRLFNEVPFAVISTLSGETVGALESRYRRAVSAMSKILKSI